MPREPLERLLADVTDDELEHLRDAILQEEGRRRAQFHLAISEPHPPLEPDGEDAALVTRWARLLSWLAKEAGVPPAQAKRGVSIRLVCVGECPDPHAAGIMVQQALVEAGLLLGRAPEWMDATVTQAEQGDQSVIHIDMWEKPGSEILWAASAG
jgi:hypothetical protein